MGITAEINLLQQNGKGLYRNRYVALFRAHFFAWRILLP
jgi:hypothetical protein